MRPGEYFSGLRRCGMVLSAVLLLSVAAGTGGCVQRTIRVTSEPQGAVVWLNNYEVGRTPVDVGFVHYGDYDLRLEKPGFETLVTNARVRAPVWDLPGPDLVAELLPVPLHSRVHVHFDLIPLDDSRFGGREGLIERSRLFRARVEAMPRPVSDHESVMQSLQPIRVRPDRDRREESVHGIDLEAELLSDDPFRE